MDNRLCDSIAYAVLELLPTFVLLRTLKHRSPSNSPSSRSSSPSSGRVTLQLNISSAVPNERTSLIQPQLPVRPQPMRPTTDMSHHAILTDGAGPRASRPRPAATETAFHGYTVTLPPVPPLPLTRQFFAGHAPARPKQEARSPVVLASSIREQRRLIDLNHPAPFL
jgi:hypothetical protein